MRSPSSGTFRPRIRPVTCARRPGARSKSSNRRDRRGRATAPEKAASTKEDLAQAQDQERAVVRVEQLELWEDPCRIGHEGGMRPDRDELVTASDRRNATKPETLMLAIGGVVGQIDVV